jgi:hypothetical protein
MCTLWPWLLTGPWYNFPLTLSCPWCTFWPCQPCHYIPDVRYFLTLPTLSLRTWCTFWPCQTCHYVPGVLSDLANLVITSLVYCLTLPTLSLRPWCTYFLTSLTLSLPVCSWCTVWPCQPCHYLPGVLSHLDNLVITSLVYFMTLPTLSLRPWRTFWPCRVPAEEPRPAEWIHPLWRGIGWLHSPAKT